MGSRSSRPSSETTRPPEARLRLPALARHRRPELLARQHGAVLDGRERDRRRRGSHLRAAEPRERLYALAYKDDPTILGWDLLNGGGSPRPWTEQIAQFVHGIDKRHLVLSGYANARLAGVDACVGVHLPHWFQGLGVVKPWIAACRARRQAVHRVRVRLGSHELPHRRSVPHVPRHARGRRRRSRATRSGRSRRTATATAGCRFRRHERPDRGDARESGQWWALYYPGSRRSSAPPRTWRSVHSSSGRTTTPCAAHACRRMRGRRADRHLGRVRTDELVGRAARGVLAGIGGRCELHRAARRAARRPVARRVHALRDGRRRRLRRCGAAARGAWYRVIPYNLDGRRGGTSKAVQAS